jgi:hypothetical protein
MAARFRQGYTDMMVWPKQDRIRWVEWRRNERLSEEAGRNPDRDLDGERVPDRLSLEVWLAKERDGLSWQQIVIKYFPEYNGREKRPAGISKARRVWMVVERALSPTPKLAAKYLLDGRIQDLFACTPEQFKRYLESIPTRKRIK